MIYFLYLVFIAISAIGMTIGIINKDIYASLFSIWIMLFLLIWVLIIKE